MKLNNTAF